MPPQAVPTPDTACGTTRHPSERFAPQGATRNRGVIIMIRSLTARSRRRRNEAALRKILRHAEPRMRDELLILAQRQL